MSQIKQDLTIISENIERAYQKYSHQRYIVNRRYQRKLVWSVEEKISFIDSIAKGYPVPLFLLAEIEYNGETRFEIIDGMQRLNAIMSFIEQEFDYEGFYFDLETMVETKYALDKGQLSQKEPKLARDKCTKIATYVLPLSVYKEEGLDVIDDIFRRINSGGRQLSRHELRQAGATNNFSDIVRRISSTIRGDVSSKEQLYLNSMKEISITNKNLSYGINVSDLFWVSQHIFRREAIRQSQDEELIAYILGYMLLGPDTSARADYLNNYFGIAESKTELNRYHKINQTIDKLGSDLIFEQFLHIYDSLRLVLNKSDKKFNELVNRDARSNLPRYFQIIFLAFYEFLIKEEMMISDYDTLITKLDGIDSCIEIYQGGMWPAEHRKKNIDAVKGVIRTAFKQKGPQDPSLNSWAIELETLLMQSCTEQTLYDFKQGFHRLNESGDFSETTFSKVIKTLTAIGNSGPGTIGYVIVGIPDKKSDCKQISNLYSLTPIAYRGFCITGIQCEAIKYHGNVDSYYQFILQKLSNEPISEEVKAQLGNDVRLIDYYDVSLLVFKIISGTDPISYNQKFYRRNGPNICEVMSDGMPELFRRFYAK